MLGFRTDKQRLAPGEHATLRILRAYFFDNNTSALNGTP